MNRRSQTKPSYPNDDYSRYAGPDYDRHVNYPDRASLSQASDHLFQPGVSGKDRNEGSWFNESQYQTQKNFVGKGPKGYRRQDATIHEEVCEALKRDRMVDATDIEVEVNEGNVTLRGTVPNRLSKKEAENCIEDLHGVQDVFNFLTIRREADPGTQALIKNQTRM